MLFVGLNQFIGLRNHFHPFKSASVTSTSSELRRSALYTSSNLGKSPRKVCSCCASNLGPLHARQSFADSSDSSEFASRRSRGAVPLSKGRRKLRKQCSPLQAHKNSKTAKSGDRPLRITSDKDVEASYSGLDDSQGLEAGVIPESRLLAEDPSSTSAQASTSGRLPYGGSAGSILYPPAQRNHIRESWCSPTLGQK